VKLGANEVHPEFLKCSKGKGKVKELASYIESEDEGEEVGEWGLAVEHALLRLSRFLEKAYCSPCWP